MPASQLRSVTATTSYVALPDLAASRVSILNKTGDDLLIEMAGDSDTDQEISLADGSNVVVQVVGNAKEVRIKSASGTTGVYLVIDS